MGGPGGGEGGQRPSQGQWDGMALGLTCALCLGKLWGGGCPIPMSLGWEVGGRAGGCRESMRVGVGQSIPRGRGQRDMEKSDV